MELNYLPLGRILQIILIKGKLCKLTSTRESSAFLKFLHFAYNYKINFKIVASITNFILSSYIHNKLSINIFKFTWSLVHSNITCLWLRKNFKPVGSGVGVFVGSGSGVGCCVDAGVGSGTRVCLSKMTSKIFPHSQFNK